MLKIINGHFYDNDLIVKPEFGNLEQIKTLNFFNSYKERLLNDEFVKISDYFKDTPDTFMCICGKYIILDEHFLKKLEECDDYITCQKCTSAYEVSKVNNNIIIKYEY